MAGFKSVKTLVDNMEDGKSLFSSFRKTPSITTLAGHFYDMSMLAGSPTTNFYASTPLAAQTINGRAGIYAGADASPDTKYVKSIVAMGNNTLIAPSTLILCDYLLYYPFIDGDSIDEQALDNAITLPRYTDGMGVRAFVVAQGTYVGGARFKITYTNENGVSGRESRWVTSNVATVATALITSGTNANAAFPFIPLQEMDKGIRSVESFRFEAPNGGIFALVLCAPIVTTTIREPTAPVEKDFFKDTGMANRRFYDGAYLNFLILPAGNISGTVFTGLTEIVWG